jgi:hypothetical protein
MLVKYILNNYLKSSLKVKLLMYPYFVMVLLIATIYDVILAFRTSIIVRNWR